MPSPPASCTERSTIAADRLADEDLGPRRLLACPDRRTRIASTHATAGPARPRGRSRCRRSVAGPCPDRTAGAEERRAARPVERDVVSAPGEPSQRMQWVSRAGASRTCALAKPRPTSPSTASSVTNSVVAARPRSGRRRTARRWCAGARRPASPGLSASTRNIVAPSGAPSRCAPCTIANAAPSAPVIRCLRPSMTQPPSTFRATVEQRRRVGPGPGRRLGHRETRAELPSASGRR